MNKNIVITGMGAITPIGIGVNKYWDGVKKGVCGIDEIKQIDVSNLPIKRAAEVKGFDASAYLPKKLVMDLEPFMLYAYVAAMEAVEMSGLKTESDRVGVVMGTALSGMTGICSTAANLAVSGKAAGPKYLTKAMGNIAAAHFAINHKITGPSMTVTTACSSGGDAVILAAMMLRSGMADAIVVMGAEAALCPELIQSLTKVMALSKTGESRPFDVNRNGFVIGEGGGALILETEEHATARKADVICRLLGVANNNDAFNPVSPEVDGRGAAECMKLALKDAGISPDAVDYINAHGTATLVGDIAESCAVRKVFGNHPVFVSSTKGMTGHMMGAGGITELIACIKAIETGIMPVNVGMSEPDPRCDVNIVTRENCRKEVKVAMSNSLGFGGQNTSIIVGR